MGGYGRFNDESLILVPNSRDCLVSTGFLLTCSTLLLISNEASKSHEIYNIMSGKNKLTCVHIFVFMKADEFHVIIV